jgi:hypothetical protein
MYISGGTGEDVGTLTNAELKLARFCNIYFILIKHP